MPGEGGGSPKMGVGREIGEGAPLERPQMWGGAGGELWGNPELRHLEGSGGGGLKGEVWGIPKGAHLGGP